MKLVARFGCVLWGMGCTAVAARCGCRTFRRRGRRAAGTESYDDEYHGVCGGCTMTQQLKNREQVGGLKLVPKSVRRAGQEQVIREGSTGRAVATLTNALRLRRVWAVAERAAAAPPVVSPRQM